MIFARIASTFAVSSFIALGACSSSSGGDDCAQAQTIANQCSASQSTDSGTTVTVTFNQSQCEGSSQGKQAASCIVANESNCGCVLTCSIKGSCP